MRPCILTIEDDAAIRRGIVDALRFAGYDTLEAADGQSGLEMASRREFDLLLLDLVLPKRDGFEILREVRRLRPTLPVIVLTARGDEADRVRGLRDGADDYVVKPFSVKELLARVEAVLRRSAERPTNVSEIAISGGTIDLARREVRFAKAGRAELSEREAELAALPGIELGPGHRPRRVAGKRVAHSAARRLDSHDRHAHHAPAREVARRSRPSRRVLLTVRGKGYMFQS